MDSSTAPAHGGTDAAREKRLVEAIRRKREQLDEEVEIFRGLKEREFRAFEARLRMLPGGVVDVGRVEAELRGGRARVKIGKGKGKKGERGHEREREFEGLFTPRFLPLLGGEGEGVGKEKEERGKVGLEKGWLVAEEEGGDEARRGVATVAARLQVERDEARTEIAAARRSGQSMLSCSAECRRSGMTSPLAVPARPLSSSVPPEGALDHRRSSSRSDANIDRRRSSLRNSREPRSPKRVQFSIDDTVVSPSTSPVANRCDESVYRNPTNPTKGAKGFERFEVLRGQGKGKPSSNGIEGSNGGRSSSNATLNTPDNGDKPLGNYIRPLGSKLDTSLSLSTGVEDSFDILDNDEDVFAFDEDIGARGSSAAMTSKEDEAIDDDEEEPEKKIEPSLTGSSPHAGSLPIEIRWGPSMRRSFQDD